MALLCHQTFVILQDDIPSLRPPQQGLRTMVVTQQRTDCLAFAAFSTALYLAACVHVVRVGSLLIFPEEPLGHTYSDGI